MGSCDLRSGRTRGQLYRGVRRVSTRPELDSWRQRPACYAGHDWPDDLYARIRGRGSHRRRVALALSGGNDDTVKTASASAHSSTTTSTTTTTTTTPTTTTVVPAGGASGNASGASGQAPAAGSNNQPAAGTAKPPPATGSPTTTTTTQPPLPKPQFTQASASPSSVHCRGGEFPSVVPITVSFTATNSTRVDGPGGFAFTSGGSATTLSTSFVAVADACAANHPTQVALTATGPGGTATTTVTWSYA